MFGSASISTAAAAAPPLKDFRPLRLKDFRLKDFRPFRLKDLRLFRLKDFLPPLKDFLKLVFFVNNF